MDHPYLLGPPLKGTIFPWNSGWSGSPWQQSSPGPWCGPARARSGSSRRNLRLDAVGPGDCPWTSQVGSSTVLLVVVMGEVRLFSGFWPMAKRSTSIRVWSTGMIHDQLVVWVWFSGWVVAGLLGPARVLLQQVQFLGSWWPAVSMKGCIMISSEPEIRQAVKHAHYFAFPRGWLILEDFCCGWIRMISRSAHHPLLIIKGLWEGPQTGVPLKVMLSYMLSLWKELMIGDSWAHHHVETYPYCSYCWMSTEYQGL